MKCPNCGAEIKDKKVCDFCGTQITMEMQRTYEQLNRAGCPKCHSTNIQFRRENQGEISREKSKQIVHKTVGFCKDCGYTWLPTGVGQQEPRKNNLWLLVLGWIFIFPVPLTILMLRKKEMKTLNKYGIIAIAWIIYLIIGLTGNSSDESEKIYTDASISAVVESTSATTTAAETISEKNATTNTYGYSKAENVVATTTYGYSETEKAADETTVKRKNLSQTDILINDIIGDTSRYYSEKGCVNGNTLIWRKRKPNSEYRCVAMYNTETKELKQLTDWTDETVTFVCLNERVYIDYNNWNGYDITNLVLCYDMQGNKIFEEESYGGWLYLEDGRILCGTTICDKNLENPVELPTLTIDIGHGLTEEYIAEVACVYKNKAYVNYSYIPKVINLDTLEISDASDYDEIFCRSSGMFNGKYAIGNIGDWLTTYKNKSVIVNLDTKEVYEYENLSKYIDGEYFVTQKAFYYVKEYALYKYISENKSEIVYDGSRYSSNFDLVSEDYLIVSDEMGTFLIDRDTGEETKLEFKTEW